MLAVAVDKIVVTALSWPVGAISRRRFGAAIPLSGLDLKSYRWVRGFSWLVLAALLTLWVTLSFHLISFGARY